MQKTESPWHMPVAVDDIPDTGLHLEIEAGGAARAGLAAHAGVCDIPHLCATFDLTRRGAAVHVSGRVTGRVEQTCVVTLDPVENAVEEAIDVRFVPDAGGHPARACAVHVPDEDEEPEPLIGGHIDLGALAAEFLVLGIDPYPRKPGAEFTPPAPPQSGERPFADLEALKKRLGGETS